MWMLPDKKSTNQCFRVFFTFSVSAVIRFNKKTPWNIINNEKKMWYYIIHVAEVHDYVTWQFLGSKVVIKIFF